MPDLYIITGSNGAGKSSVGNIYLPENIRADCEIFDGDKLFLQKQKLLWQQGITAIKEARNIAYQFVSSQFDKLTESALQNNANFVYEGHFTNEATWETPKRFKENGYHVHLIFLGLKNVALSKLRVLDRTKRGGHYVQPAEISGNFYGNLEKPNKYYILFDAVTIIDTSKSQHRLLVYIENSIVINSVHALNLPDWFINGLPAIYQAIVK